MIPQVIRGAPPPVLAVKPGAKLNPVGQGD